MKKYLAIKNFLVIGFVFGLIFITCGHIHAEDSLVHSVEKIGPVKNMTAPQTLYRDGASSVKLGNKILWLFGDTLFTEVSEDGTNARTNTAASGATSSPYILTEPLDANGAPSQFIPYNSAETSYNLASSDPNDRYVIWPTEAVNIDENTAYIYYLRYKSTPNPTTLAQLGIGIASVTTNSSTATVINEAVFSSSEAQFRPTAVKDQFVYLRDCHQDGFNANCAIARVAKNQMATRSSYEFWNGTTWQPNISQAAYNVPGSPSAMTITWSDYLQKFVLLSAAGFSKHITIRTADQIQGPWSTAQTAYTDSTSNYPSILYFHPELTTNNGQSLVFTATENYVNLNGGDGIIAFRLNLTATAQAPSNSEEITEVPGVPNTGGFIRSYGAFIVTGIVLIIALIVKNRQYLLDKFSDLRKN